MPEVREEGLSEANRTMFNSRVINGTSVKMPAPGSTRCATFHNRNRSEIHRAVFKRYLETFHKDCGEDNVPRTAIVIRAGTRWKNSQRPLSNGHRKVLFEQCSEADCRNGESKRCDPLLCLYYGCHIMGTNNDDVHQRGENGRSDVDGYCRYLLTYALKFLHFIF